MKDIEKSLMKELRCKEKIMMKSERDNMEMVLKDRKHTINNDYVITTTKVKQVSLYPETYSFTFLTKYFAVGCYKKLKEKYEMKDIDLLADAL